ncbi:uncharacterized protein [Nothobranchius furzeri]
MFFSATAAGDKDLDRAAQEATFADHLVKHNHNFRSMDWTAGLLRKCYDQHFTSARTKAEAVVTSVIAPHAIDLLKEDTTDTTLVSATVDTSNHKAVKLVPVVVRYFKITEGVRVKILDFTSLTG